MKLRKLIPAVLLCAVLIISLTFMFSCKGGDHSYNDNYTAKELADAIMNAYSPDELPEGGLNYLYSDADEDSNNYLDDEFAGFLINGSFNPPEGFEYISDCAFYFPAGRNIFEVDVLKIKKEDENNLKALEELLNNRLNRIKSSDVLIYTPEDKPLLDNAKIMTFGNYVVFLATTDNSKAEQVISDMLKSN